MDYGRIGGTSPNVGKTATKFRCSHPASGPDQIKRVFKREGMTRPVALWYEHGGTWFLNSVVDGDNLPDWAKNYTQTEAVPA